MATSITVATRIIQVSEIFGPTVQGEGMLIGKPTVFVRTGGCEYRCYWCDTLYAVLPEYKSEWHPMTTGEIFAEVQRLSGHQPILVTLSGGNPAIQPLGDLIDLGHAHGYTFAIETQGSVAQPWFARLEYLTLSPKPPSSKQVTRWERLDRCISYAGTAAVQPLPARDLLAAGRQAGHALGAAGPLHLLRWNCSGPAAPSA